MTLSIQQLQNPPTRKEIASWMVDQLRSLGFVTTGWQPGRIQQQILNMVATVAEPVGQVASELTNMSFNSIASGVGLELYSLSRFNNTKSQALSATGHFQFNNVGTVGHPVVAGKIVIQDRVSGLLFTSDEDTSVPAGSTVSVRVKASLKGQSGNIPNLSTLTLITPLAGVTVSNPSPFPTQSPIPSWADIQTGADPETDSELREKNATKWGLLAVEKTDTAMINLAVSQDSITKAKVISNSPRGPGTVDVYVAGQSGALNSVEMSNAQSLFAEYTFLTEESWPPSTASSVALVQPTEQPLNIEGSVYYDNALTSAEVESSVSARLDALVALTDIGGNTYSENVDNVLTIADITDVIKDTPGVNSCTVVSPAGDVPVGLTSVLVRPALGWFDPTLLVSRPGSR